MTAATPGQAARDDLERAIWRVFPLPDCDAGPKHRAAIADALAAADTYAQALAVQEPHAADEVAAATAATRRTRDIVCNLLDLFGAPDRRLMQHASVTRATLLRYAREAGVRLDGLPAQANPALPVTTATQENQ